MTLSPIQRIPPELLGEIFIRCIPDDTFIRPTPSDAPLLLGQICSEWRHMALSTPILWSSLSVKVTSGISDPDVSLIELWLDRSGTSPLSLSLNHDDHEDWEVDDGTDIVTAILDMFNVHFQRWKNFELLLPDPCPGYALSNLPDTEASCLEDLNLQFGGGLDILEIEVLIHVFHSTPRLRRFSWGYFPLGLDFLAIRWDQLTDLRLDCEISAAAVLDILHSCSKLITCYLDGLSDKPNTETLLPGRRVLLSELRSLTVIPLRSSKPFFDRLTLPALRNLSVINSSPPIPPAVQDHFTSFLSRSKCPLESLVFYSTGISEETTIQCLQVVTASLVELDLQSDKGTTIKVDNLLCMLTFQDSKDATSQCLCPRLQTIRFGEGISSSDGLLAAMIVSRQCSKVVDAPGTFQVSRLRRAEADFLSSNPLDSICRLRFLDDPRA